MIQSLVHEGNVNDIVATYGHVIVDECHHIPAVSFERVLSEIKARYVVGLTATPHRRDGHHPILEMQFGPMRFSVDPKQHAAQRPFHHRLVERETPFRLNRAAAEMGIQEIYQALAVSEERNRLIIDDVVQALQDGCSPILLTERREHLEYFAAKLGSIAPNMIVLRGGMTPRERRELSTKLAGIPDHESRLVIATAISWKGTLVQYTGRLHRLHSRKTEVRIFDYVDREVPVLVRMFEKRLRTYRSLGYAPGEARASAVMS
jgi:superfamily II DNA or RNA helicase